MVVAGIAILLVGAVAYRHGTGEQLFYTKGGNIVEAVTPSKSPKQMVVIIFGGLVLLLGVGLLINGKRKGT